VRALIIESFEGIPGLVYIVQPPADFASPTEPVAGRIAARA
jgi:hypothetical protein